MTRPALDLARTRGVDAPGDYAGMFAALCPGKRRLGSQAEPLRSLAAGRVASDVEALERATRELVESKVADHVRYAEIKWGLCTRPLQEVLAASPRGRTRSASSA